MPFVDPLSQRIRGDKVRYKIRGNIRSTEKIRVVRGASSAVVCFSLPVVRESEDLGARRERIAYRYYRRVGSCELTAKMRDNGRCAGETREPPRMETTGEKRTAEASAT